jgi:hypothetical protein
MVLYMKKFRVNSVIGSSGDILSSKDVYSVLIGMCSPELDGILQLLSAFYGY